MCRTFALLCLLLAAGCDEGGGEESASPDPTSPAAGDTYVAGLQKAGADEQITARLLEAHPAPPERGNNRWVLEVVDGATPLTGCVLVLDPNMPAHGHGTWEDAVVTEMEAPGRYAVEPILLYMPGLWEIPITITCGEVTDTVRYAFWIEG